MEIYSELEARLATPIGPNVWISDDHHHCRMGIERMALDRGNRKKHNPVKMDTNSDAAIGAGKSNG